MSINTTITTCLYGSRIPAKPDLTLVVVLSTVSTGEVQLHEDVNTQWLIFLSLFFSLPRLHLINRRPLVFFLISSSFVLLSLFSAVLSVNHLFFFVVTKSTCDLLFSSLYFSHTLLSLDSSHTVFLCSDCLPRIH